MRPIKFRQWTHFDSGEWGMLDHDCLDFWRVSELLQQDEGEVLMQFTGLLDKNGKEIYEGDVVEITGIGSLSGMRKEIKYNLDEFVKYDGISTMELGYDISTWGTYEVIGNIYENSNLLNNGQ